MHSANDCLDDLMKVDFVLAGGPKCATTSLFATLGQRHDVNMAYLKEPHFYARDLPGCRQVMTQRAYEALFDGSNLGRAARGEASVYYLYSRVALAEMVAVNPSLRVVAVVRNPLDVFPSLHNELIKSLDEDKRDLEIAWGLQAERRLGKSIPIFCKEPLLLQYKAVCSFGEQIHRARQVLPKGQLHVVLFEDLVKDPTGKLSQLVRFLGLDGQLSMVLPRENEFAVLRSIRLAQFLKQVFSHGALNDIRLLGKRHLNPLGIRPLAWIGRANLRRTAKPRLNDEFKRTLYEEFSEDIGRLESLLQRDLRHWRDMPADKR